MSIAIRKTSSPAANHGLTGSLISDRRAINTLPDRLPDRSSAKEECALLIASEGARLV